MFYNKARSKYGNHKQEYNGMTFDGKKELERYQFLKDAERRGLITELRRQVPFVLYPDEYEEHDEVVHLKTKDKVVHKRTRSYIGVKYIADFVYYSRKLGRTVVEDVKISPKLLPKEYVLKEKAMHYIHGIDIHRVYKATDNDGI